MLTRWTERLGALLRRRRFEHELDDELRFHLEMETSKNVQLGMSPERAAREARRAFGGLLRTKEDVRGSHGLGLFDALGQDVRFAMRDLRHRYGYALMVVANLAIGIGATTAVFSAVYGVLLRPLPFGAGDRLVVLEQSSKSVDNVGFSVKEFHDYRALTPSLDALVEYHTMPFTLLGHGDPRRVQTGVVSADYFDVLGVEPLLGRTFEPGEDALGADAVLVMSYEFWQSHADGDESVVGALVEMNDRPHRVVGVLPPVPDFPHANDVYMPVSACPFHSAPKFLADRGARMMTLLGRRREGHSLEDVRRDLHVLQARLHREHPEVYPERAEHAVRATPLAEAMTEAARPTFLLLVGTAAFVLLIACANVANIMLSRVLERQEELQLRAAVGASRARIARQLLTEASVLVGLGGAAGLGLAVATLGMLVRFVARFTPRAAEITLDAHVLAFALGATCVTGLLFGTVTAALPAIDPRGGRVRRALVSVEVAASLVLLVGAGLMTRSLLELHAVDAGLQSERVLTMLVDLDWSVYDRSERVRDFHSRLLADLSEHPEIVSAAMGRTFPLARGETPLVARFDADDHGEGPALDLHSVSPEYFRTIGVGLVEGRAFHADDAPGAPTVALVNEAAASTYWPEGSPVDESLSAGDETARIVGVVENVRQYGLDAAATPAIYVPLSQFPRRVTRLVVRTLGDPRDVTEHVVERVHAIDPRQAVARIQTMDDARRDALAVPRVTTTLISLFASLALVITVAGIGGVIALTVSRRENELGIRMALGATPGRVIRLVLSEAALLIAVGVGFGSVGIAMLRPTLERHLFQVRALDPVTLVAVGALLIVAAAIACWVPALRATRIEPLVALRSD